MLTSKQKYGNLIFDPLKKVWLSLLGALYMLTAAVRLAALHCSTRKQQVQLATGAHTGVECPHVGVTAGRLQKGQPTSAVTVTSGCVQPTVFH